MNGSVLERQMEFYAKTAASYDSWHVDAHDEHFAALDLAVPFIRAAGSGSLLDVGCGTGRALQFFAERLPELSLHGIDPSVDLLKVAAEKSGVPKGSLTCGNGYNLPCADNSYDAVIATGVLHHVENSRRFINEMVRVAKKMVLISDTNMYGRGVLPYRLLKLVARSMRLDRQLTWLRYGGHSWFDSGQDGIAFAYSIFDSLSMLRVKFPRVTVQATAGESGMHAFPLMFASHGLVIARC